MRIKTRLQISIVTIFALFFIAGLSIKIVSRHLSEGNRLVELADRIEHDVVKLDMLIHDYLLNPGKRSIDQYHLKYQELKTQLSRNPFKQVEEKILFHDMHSNYKQLGVIYVKLISVQDKLEKTDTDQIPNILQQKKRLSERVLVKSQILASTGSRLRNLIKLRLKKTLKKAILSIVILLSVIFGLVVFIFIWIFLSVIPPITKLEQGVKILGTGNLDYKIATTAQDEIGELSRSFDLMTESLSTITVSRDELSKEVETRKEIEKQREKIIGNLQKALSEIKTLKGILPICSYCKKIRDDKGYWDQIDAYINKHTDVDFSHGICPECEKKHFLGFVDDD